MKAVSIIKKIQPLQSIKKLLRINIFLSLALFVDILLLLIASVAAFARAVSDMKSDSLGYTSDPIYPADIATTILSILMPILILLIIIFSIFIVVRTIQLSEKPKRIIIVSNLIIILLYIIELCIVLFNEDGWTDAMIRAFTLYPLVTAVLYFLMQKYLVRKETYSIIKKEE